MTSAIPTEGGVSPSVNAKADHVSQIISNMLSEMEEDFQKSGDSVMERMREMGANLDDLEQNIYGLMHDAGLEEEDLNTSKASADIASSSSPQNAPSNASPSRKTEGVQL